MKLYRLQHRKSFCGPIHHHEDRNDRVFNVRNHQSPSDIAMSDRRRRLINRGDFMYFFTTLDKVFSTFIPKAVKLEEFWKEWEIICVDTKDVARGDSYIKIGEEQRGVHFNQVFAHGKRLPKKAYKNLIRPLSQTA